MFITAYCLRLSVCMLARWREMNVKSAMTAIARKHLFVLVIKCKEKVVVQQNENEKTLVFSSTFVTLVPQVFLCFIHRWWFKSQARLPNTKHCVLNREIKWFAFSFFNLPQIYSFKNTTKQKKTWWITDGINRIHTWQSDNGLNPPITHQPSWGKSAWREECILIPMLIVITVISVTAEWKPSLSLKMITLLTVSCVVAFPSCLDCDDIILKGSPQIPSLNNKDPFLEVTYSVSLILY